MSITSIQSILRSNLPRVPVGSTGFTGSNGFTGSRGETGAFGGVTFDFKFSSNTDSSQDPGEGHLKFNDISMLSATQLYIRNVDNSSTNLDSYLTTIDASTSELKGHFKLSNKTRPENFVIFAITGTSEKIDDYFVVPCAFVSGDLTDSSTTFEHDDDVLITFARTGDRGDRGFTGNQGDVGFTGSLGFTGSRGETGSGLNFVGAVSTENLLPTPYTGDINDAYLVEDTGVLWIWDGASWDQIGQFTGYTGSRGASGASVRLLGSVSDIANLPQDGTSDGSTLLVPGDGFIVQSTGDLYIWTGSSWSNVGKITGNAGPIGYTGSQGIPGEFAALGYTGSRGADGASGFMGSTGFTGSRGVVGYTGSRGADGTAVDIVGSAASYANLPSPYNGNVGDGYLTQDNGHLNVWMGSSWLDVGPIRGYTGSVGRLETWTKITSNFTAENNQRLIADTSGGTFTVTLPANPTLGYYVVITDGSDWSTNPLLVDGNGNDVEYQQDQISLDITDVTVEFIWNVSSWEVTATLGVRGVTGFTGSQGLPGEAAFRGYTGSSPDLLDVGSNIIPSQDETYDLGSASNKWRHLYVGANTIFIGNSSLTVDEANNQLILTSGDGSTMTPVGGTSVEVTSTAPADPETGDLWYDTANEEFKVYVNNQWVPGAKVASIYDKTTSSAGYLALPAGDTSQRPDLPAIGQTRYNTTLNRIEYYDPVFQGWMVVQRATPAVGLEIMPGDGGALQIQSSGINVVNIAANGVISTLDLNPMVNNTHDLGTADLRWRNIYTNDLNLKNAVGDWTIVEGEEDLFLYNNKNNKVYKFALVEIDPRDATPKNNTR